MFRAISGIIIGCLIGFIYAMHLTQDRIIFHEESAYQYGKISFKRGCAEASNQNIELCKRLLTQYMIDTEQIFTQVDYASSMKKDLTPKEIEKIKNSIQKKHQELLQDQILEKTMNDTKNLQTI